MTVCEMFTCDRVGCPATEREPLRSPDVAMGQSLPEGWICWPHTEPGLHFCSVACFEARLGRVLEPIWRAALLAKEAIKA